MTRKLPDNPKAKKDTSNMSRNKVYRVYLHRTVETTIDVIASSEDDAEDICAVGVEVREDGTLCARKDCEALVVDWSWVKNNDEVQSIEEIGDADEEDTESESEEEEETETEEEEDSHA